MARVAAGLCREQEPMARRRIVTFDWATADGYLAGVDGKDLIIFGSGSIVRSVSRRLPLELLEARRLPSGDVILRYARATRESGGAAPAEP